MSIYSFSDIELQAYKNIWIAIQNYDVHAELPAIDSEKVLTLYKSIKRIEVGLHVQSKSNTYA